MEAPQQENTDNRAVGNDDIVRELSEEEFDPKGTLALTLLYFVLITLLWFFMYFVEFAEHGPSILS